MATSLVGTVDNVCQETEDFKQQVIAALESPDGPKDLKTLAKLLRDLSSVAYDKSFALAVK